jgi:hypothetical protein
MAIHVKRLRIGTFAMALAMQLVACGGGDQNLWERRYSSPKNQDASASRNDVTGYWEGEIAMGGVRTKIEPARIVIAIKCDKEGKIVSQGSAPIAFTTDDPAKITLQEDLLSTGKDNETCGFRFYKGNAFKYRLTERGVLELNFAGAAMSRFKKLSDLEPSK